MESLKKHTLYLEEKLGEVNFPNKPMELYDPLRYFLAIGGKRIRPILTLMAAELFGKSKDRAFNQALAIELFHNFTLIHDDIMDDAPLRRGVSTVHEKWNTNVAILSGDSLLIKSYQYLCKTDEQNLPSIMEVFNKTAIEVCEGQQLDMDFENRIDVTTAEYIEMIRLKTSVLLGCALQLGAIVAGASDKDQKSIYQFGVNVGIAFQIQDDILDLYADPEKFGKQIGGDVLANKKTILYLTAVSKSNESQLKLLKQLQSEEDASLKLSRTKELFDYLDVKSTCKELMDMHFGKAMSALELVDGTEEGKLQLKELALLLMNRDS